MIEYITGFLLGLVVGYVLFYITYAKLYLTKQEFKSNLEKMENNVIAYLKMKKK